MFYQNLITAAQLNENLGDTNWLMFDCRFNLADVEEGRKSYAQSHIPGAIYAHLDEHLSSQITPDSGRHPLPHTNQLLAWLASCGMSRDKQVVVYDHSGGAMAVRLWWLLKCFGHGAVAVLDGGWPAWMDMGYATTAKLTRPAAGQYHAEFDRSRVVSIQEVMANLTSKSFQLVDVRSSERFSGANEPIDPVAGHIPGAINIPLTENLDESGCFKSPQQLRELYAPLTRQYAADQQVYMCGSGVTACHSLLAMQLAGYPMPRLYDGSWSEWIRDPARPVSIIND